MTYNEATEYVKKNGITLFKTTEHFQKIPKGTKLYFGLCSEYLSTHDSDIYGKNKEFGYNFDYEWIEGWENKYKSSFELVEGKLEKPNKLIIHCPKKEDYIKLVDEIGWDDGRKRYDLWDGYKDKTTVNIEDGKIGGYALISFYKKEERYKDYTFLTADEYFNNNKSNNKILSNIVKFAKNLTLSKVERLLREQGLKDDCGNYTEEFNALRRLKANEAFEKEAIEIAKEKEKEEDK